MMMRSMLVVATLVAFSFGTVPAHDVTLEDANAKSKAAVRILVLLVGVSEYDDSRHNLKGPANDVVLVEKTLRDRFGNRIARTVVLSAKAADGQAMKPELQPTRQNIEREFRSLADAAQENDQVFILLAGHGSQQPDTDGDEPDGRDEIFLPQDIGEWTSGLGQVENSISDDELREWLSAIRSKQASVFFVADCCHSGSIARGNAAVSRSVTPEDLKIPSEAFPATRGNQVTDPKPLNLGAGIVALYGAHSHQSAFESTLPQGSAQRHGWLSWALCEVLQQSQGQLSYSRLAHHIDWIYQQNSWNGCQPLIEGIGDGVLDADVLGTELVADQAFALLTKSGRDKWGVTAGILKGLTKGSILRVVNSDGATLGFVRVIETGSVGSVVEPVAFADLPTPAGLKDDLECRLESRDLGAPDLNVFITGDGDSDGLVTQINAATSSSTTPLSIRVVNEISSADVVILTKSGEQTVLVAEVADTERSKDGQFEIRSGNRWLTFAQNDVIDALRRAVAAINLRAMASYDDGSETSIQLKITAERVTAKKTEPLTGDVVLRNGDKVRITVENTGRLSADITALYVSSNWNIESFFPRFRSGNAANRLAPGEKARVTQFTIDNTTVGLEHLVVVAVNSNNVAPVSFAFLQQEGLAVARERTARGPEDPPHPLDALLVGRMTGGERGGAATTALGDYSIRRVSWTVE